MLSNGAIVFKDHEPELDFKLDEIIYTSLRYLPFKKIVFVFVGDQSQLPPLKHFQVPALDEEYFQNRYNLTAKKIILKNISPNEKSGILNLADRFKKTDDTKEISIPKTSDIEKFAEFIENEIIDTFFSIMLMTLIK